VQNPSPISNFFAKATAMAHRTLFTSQNELPVQLPRNALDELMPVVYGELRRMALSFLRRERPNHTLQPTALAHEVYLRLADQRRLEGKDRAQFFGLAAQMMRRILINHAEAHHAAKRGPALKLSLEEAEAQAASGCKNQDLNVLALNDALTSLAAIDAEKSRIVELRFFGGLTMAEIAAMLGKSLATIEREWSLARAWLFREISGKGFSG
jgi:RNA polymerase sigma factor (TIGR02999 family)